MSETNIRPELTDRAEAVLWVINGTIPGACVDERDGRDILVTRNGIGVDLAKLATEIATFLDTLDERKQPVATTHECCDAAINQSHQDNCNRFGIEIR